MLVCIGRKHLVYHASVLVAMKNVAYVSKIMPCLARNICYGNKQDHFFLHLVLLFMMLWELHERKEATRPLCLWRLDDEAASAHCLVLPQPPNPLQTHSQSTDIIFWYFAICNIRVLQYFSSLGIAHNYIQTEKPILVKRIIQTLHAALNVVLSVPNWSSCVCSTLC